jgi:hypothetical protein
VTITNEGSAPLGVSGFAISGDDPSDFVTGTDTCHGAIAPGESCSVAVRFAPQAQGARQARLTVLTNAASSMLVTLAGTAGPLPQGEKGDAGSAGSQGTQGAQGPKGDTGAPGPAGRDAKVTCKVAKPKKGKKAKTVKVTCKVVLATKNGKASVEWRLMRHGRTVAHGASHAHRGRVTLRLSDLGQLHSGRYVLRIAGRRHGTAVVIA